MRFGIPPPGGTTSTVSEAATPAGASVNVQVRNTDTPPPGLIPTPIAASKSSLVLWWNALAKATVLVVVSTAPYRIVGKPAMSKSCANQMDVPSKYGDQRMLPSEGSSVLDVRG